MRDVTCLRTKLQSVLFSLSNTITIDFKKNNNKIKTKMIDEEINKNEKEFLKENVCISVLL